MSSPIEDRFETAKISHRFIQGQRVLVKTATARERSRLRHEAEVLGLLKLSGLVEMIELKEEDDKTLLLLADNGPRTLLRPVDMSGEELLRSLQRCCTAVEQLHDAGWSHGSLRPEHVLLGARGRPRLCSLGDSQPLSHLPERVAAAAVQADVEQLALLFAHVASVQTAPMSRSERWRWKQQAHKLRQIAACSGSSSGATSARELGLAAEGLKSGQFQQRQARGSSMPRTSSRGPARGLATLGFAAAAVALFFTGGFALSAWSAAPPTTAAPTTAAPTTAPPIAPSTVQPNPPPTPSSTCGSWPISNLGLGVDVNGDSCTEQVKIDGQFITVGALSYQVGLPQDRIAVGDWNCDGQATVLLLRPSTGELFEFSNWATPEEVAESQLVSTVEQAVDLRSQPLPPSPATNKRSCDRVVVTLLDGSLVDPPLQHSKAKP